MLYLSPLVFNELSFSATQIGSGIAFAALIGTLARLITGISLDKGINFSIPIKIAGILAISADCILFKAIDYSQFLQGQFLLGASAGIYWPAAELAVPIVCEKFSTSKSFALVRSADALGISIGAITGTISSFLSNIRLIYLIDIICMCLLIALISNRSLRDKRITKIEINNSEMKIKSNQGSTINNNLIKSIFPVLAFSLFASGMLSLLQSGLPLDLVKGSIYRPSLSQTITGSIISIQLGLLVIFQWPIGNWLSNKSIRFGIKLSLISLGMGSLTLLLSAFLKEGLIMVFLSLILISIGLAAFLPTATEAIIKESPLNKRGLAMALYSQCFGISSLFAPTLAGWIIDIYGNAIFLWLIMFILSILVFPLTSDIGIVKSKFKLM